MVKHRDSDGRPIEDAAEQKPTRRIDVERIDPKGTIPDPGQNAGEPKTRLAGLTGYARNSAESAKDSGDPVVGWVVIIDGPGRGRSLSLGYGMNDIARSASARVPLDFGDDEIARTQHATITFDPRGLRFFVQHGNGKNLTYLGEAPVLAPEELHTGDEIVLGRTRLRFVALCGENFDWNKSA